jgi:putative transposase
MQDTYAQAYFHIVFAVKNRQVLIQRSWKNQLEEYITGIIHNNKHKLIAIGSMPDHMHIFIGYNLKQTIPDLVEKIMTSSIRWIKTEYLKNDKFFWQKRYAAFTHPHSHVSIVSDYILNQEFYHNKRTFRDEYFELQKKYRISYNTKSLFNFFDDIRGWDDAPVHFKAQNACSK